MKILAHVNKVRFIVKEKKKFYLISLTKEQVFEIEDPNEIYRQGYWAKYNNELNDQEIKELEKILKKFS